MGAGDTPSPVPPQVLLHVLFEHAAGYALFAVREVEEIGLQLPQVEDSVLTIGKFHNMVKLVAFSPFRSAQSALENMNAVSEGVLHEDLRLLLDTALPPKRKKVVLGVGDAKMGAAVQEELGVQCQTGGVVAELMRGIRLHFPALVRGLTAQSAAKAQLGLGHSYSRAKVKFNVHRVDNMIIQSISLLDQLDKDINTFSMRVREWYGYHFPELIKIVPENSMYCRVAKFIGNRRELSEESLEGLEEIVMDSAKAQAILEASRSSMGMDISPLDLINIESFSRRVISLSEYRRGLQEYLRSKMSQVAPSLSALIGEVVGARLISHAGSLTNLAKYPASTVQILGAEKALFRALKTRGNTPKYGLIFHSTFIGRAAAKNKGRISRYLANKCTIASRIDCFSEVPTSVFGDKLREQVEERLAFYETGEPPRKNLEVMKEAVVEANEVVAEVKRRQEKKEKKKKKREKRRLEALAAAAEEAKEENSVMETEENDVGAKKKKKKKKQQAEESEPEAEPEENGLGEEEEEEQPLPKKKRKLTVEPEQEEEEEKKKKKKKKKKAVAQDLEED
ncbi:nucleolar protein 56-like [Corapipo altera]|uniref:nucleolar protein 56-like n=1 Tax=Corapipo altera TaxID=415028 RepID=UPI000FD6ACB1|nr:nucleolar protein 56-like [Corapipo altera]XP_027487503.1 nucleolar protein 56-like [Corapipo altera]